MRFLEKIFPNRLNMFLNNYLIFKMTKTLSQSSIFACRQNMKISSSYYSNTAVNHVEIGAKNPARGEWRYLTIVYCLHSADSSDKFYNHNHQFLTFDEFQNWAWVVENFTLFRTDFLHNSGFKDYNYTIQKW